MSLSWEDWLAHGFSSVDGDAVANSREQVISKMIKAYWLSKGALAKWIKWSLNIIDFSKIEEKRILKLSPSGCELQSLVWESEWANLSIALLVFYLHE